MTQKQMVLQHLKDEGNITTWEAFSEYGITRLSQYIMELRNEGHLIAGTPGHAINRYGKKVHFCIYKMEA